MDFYHAYAVAQGVPSSVILSPPWRAKNLAPVPVREVR